MWLMPPPSGQDLAGWALLPLRAFLAVTFAFAGLQKLANPGFFDAANPASIQAQLAGSARHSPIHALLTPLSHHAVLIGTVIAVGEIAVGVGALLGLLTRIAAVGGLLISLNLFLAVSFHTNPYYTGSDIVFAFAWIPFIIAGGGQLSLDALAANLVAVRHARPARVPAVVPFSTVQEVCGHYDRGRCNARRDAPCEPVDCPYLTRAGSGIAPGRGSAPVDAERRRLVGALALGAGAVAVLGAGAVAGVGRFLHTAPTVDPSAPTPAAPAPADAGTSTPGTPSPSSTATATSSPAGPPKTAAVPKPQGTSVGPASGVPVGGAAAFQDPASGDPAIVVQPRAGTFLAFDAVCPHAGCTVQYDQPSATFGCPCHGSLFNGRTGAVEVGPASRGLGKIAIAKGQDGQLYVV